MIVRLLPKSSIGRLIGLWTALFIVTMIVSMMTGCASLTPPSMDRPPVPASLMQPCKPLTPLTGKSGAALVQKIIELAGQYHDCADGKAALIDAVK